MKKFTPNFITKVVTTLAILPIIAAPAPAKASGCYPNTAASKIHNMVAGGMDTRAAAESQFDKTIDSEACFYEVKGILRQSYGW